MVEQIHIAHWILDLGLGGDAKNLVALAREQSKWARVSVLTQESQTGPRANGLSDSSVVVVSDMVPENLAEWLNGNRTDILIVHRNGAPNKIETTIVEIANQNGTSCFEYNTFARVDKATDNLWAGHLHLSRASLAQYARRRSMSPFDLKNHKAIGYAVPLTPAITTEERAEARKLLNVPDGSFVVLRLARPDLRKWDPLPVLAMRKLKREIKTCLMLRAAPLERSAWIRSLLDESAILLEPSVLEVDLRRTLAASDVLVNYSVIGETFGLALAEAMASGLPVIVNSTPKMDNAQVELCRHGQRGLVANSVSSLAGALKYLSENPDQSYVLAQSGRQFIEGEFAPGVVESRLRQFIGTCLHSKEIATRIPQTTIIDTYQLTPEWLFDYNLSEGECFAEAGMPLAKLSDSCQLGLARIEDSILYARKIGISGIVEKVQRRLSQGSLLRG